MIEELIYTHLQKCEELIPFLADYSDGKAIFAHEVPMDTMPEWGKGAQYPRIVFTIDTMNDPERTFGGTLIVDILCDKQSYPPEEIEPVLKPLIDGYFFAENDTVVSAKWKSSDYFTNADEKVAGVTMIFNLLAYPVQLSMEPDPLRLVNKWTYEDLAGLLSKELYVIGHSGLPKVFKPSKEKPALYWRNIGTNKCGWMPDTYNCIWRTAVLQCHILTPDPKEAGSIARIISEEFTRKGCLIFESRSPLFVDRNNRITMTADPHRSGQLSVEATYGILRKRTSVELNKVFVTEKSTEREVENG